MRRGGNLGFGALVALGVVGLLASATACDTVTDTDMDGVPDYYEQVHKITDPADDDSDDNGVLDGDEDHDGDGLSFTFEVVTFAEQNGGVTIDPTNRDTDADRSSDGDEIINGTNPLDPDSDDDGILDGDEVSG